MRKGTVEENDEKDVTEGFCNGNSDDNVKSSEDKRLSPEGKVSDNQKTSSILEFKTRLKFDEAYRKKFLIFVTICYNFFVLGVNVGQFGPTILDLKNITRCSLGQASFLFNANTLGYLSSSVIVGFTFERFNKLLQMCVAAALLSVVVAVIPWCSVYEVMVTIHFLKGFFMGIEDAVGNALLIHLLASEVKTYMQILHFMFAFGGIIAPLISAPFLSTEDSMELQSHNRTTWNLSTDNYTFFQNTTGSLNVSHINTSQQIYIQSKFSIGTGSDSEVYKAYTISAILTLLSALSFIVLYCRSDQSTCPSLKSENEEHKTEKVTGRIRVFGLIILCMIIASYTALEDTYAGFLVAFTVQYFKWTKARGAFATSVFWTSFAIGRFCGIFIVNLIGQVKLLLFYSLTIIAAFICLLVTSLYQVSEGVWIASAVVGFGMSVFFPIFFSWTEEKFFHVDGKIASLIMACACIGVIINPIILSRVMDTTPIWFGYILTVESAVLLIFFAVAVYIARLVNLEHFNHDKEGDLVLEVKECNSPSNEISSL
ncbi:sodium-dependent glucose transporter 1-like [Mytilus trossulus]|uniref:sodium-dependent glucose transporter 1-like n=1 Tax=Mytilus trossulus TaxID=6551 RepID=UPI0030055384